MAAATETVELLSPKIKKFLEDMLEEMDIKNHTMDVSPGAIRGDNYMGVIAKVDIKGTHKNGKHKVLNLIVKSAPRQEIFRTVIPVRFCYGREMYIYNTVFHEFAKLQEDKTISKPFNSVPKCYKTTFEDMDEALILQNMKELDYKLLDRFKTLDYAHALLVMKEYGKFHALSFALKDQKPEKFEELVANTKSNLRDFFPDELMEKFSASHYDRAYKILDFHNLQHIHEKLQKFQKNLVAITKEMINFESLGEYGVIVHSDCWVNNMLFKYADPTKPEVPTDVCLLDFQLSCYGSPVLDLSYFIFSTTNKKLRDQHYDDLINEYYKSLSSFMRELGSDPEKLYPFEILQQHLKKYSVFGLHIAIQMMQILCEKSEDIPDLHASQSQEDMFSKMSFKIDDVSNYNERMLGVLEDFVKYNYLC